MLTAVYGHDVGIHARIWLCESSVVLFANGDISSVNQTNYLKAQFADATIIAPVCTTVPPTKVINNAVVTTLSSGSKPGTIKIIRISTNIRTQSTMRVVMFAALKNGRT